MPIYFFIADITVENHALRTVYISLIPTFMATSYKKKHVYFTLFFKEIYFVS